ncbi:MAG: acyl-CoA reductase [Schleiferiaceae bacterium]|jgi:hypothetical protein|nr:acyl-CoA reductase [Schleiferiaceae bacterium]
MDLKARITAFAELGNCFRDYTSQNQDNTNSEAFETVLIKAKVKNAWFTPENSKMAFNAWAEQLTVSKLNEWLSPYQIEDSQPKRIGIIMAGNIPLVGFHDLLVVLITGNIALVKMSSDDDVLMSFVLDKLIEIEPRFEERIIRVEKLEEPDAVIATGSNNTARYFEAYFGKYPNIIRKNRNSVAVLTGDESDDEIKLLADDLFQYFGLGCRNVTKLYIPEGFDLNRIFGNIMHYGELAYHNKYSNNYDYYRAIYMLNKEPFLENGFAVLREHENIGSPVAIIHYAYYKNIEEVNETLNALEDQLQCIVSGNGLIENSVSFGDSQKPGLADYADNVDTVEFLLEL